MHGSPGTSAEGYPAAGVLGCQERGAKRRRVPAADVTTARRPKSPFPTRWGRWRVREAGRKAGSPSAYSSLPSRVLLVYWLSPRFHVPLLFRAPLAPLCCFHPSACPWASAPFPGPPGRSRRFQLAQRRGDAQAVSGAPSRPPWPGPGTGGAGHLPHRIFPAPSWASSPGLVGECDPQRHSHILKTRSGASYRRDLETEEGPRESRLGRGPILLHAELDGAQCRSDFSHFSTEPAQGRPGSLWSERE